MHNHTLWIVLQKATISLRTCPCFAALKYAISTPIHTCTNFLDPVYVSMCECRCARASSLQSYTDGTKITEMHQRLQQSHKTVMRLFLAVRHIKKDAEETDESQSHVTAQQTNCRVLVQYCISQQNRNLPCTVHLSSGT